MSLKKFFPLALNQNVGKNIVGVNTSIDGYQVVIGEGDSNLVGQGEVKGPTSNPGIVNEWRNGGIVPLSPETASANIGSIWPRLGIEWYNRTGKKLVIVTGAVGGSSLYPRTVGDTNTWFSSGVLWSPLANNVRACLQFLKIQEARFGVRRCGINDSRGGASLSLVHDGLVYNQTRFRTEFGNNVPLFTFNLGRSEAGVTSRILSIRQMIEDEAHNYAKTYVAVRDENYLQYYKADQLHINQNGLNLQGLELANYIINNNL